jgi:hypothetical protein
VVKNRHPFPSGSGGIPVRVTPGFSINKVMTFLGPKLRQKFLEIELAESIHREVKVPRDLDQKEDTEPNVIWAETDDAGVAVPQAIGAGS